MCFNRLLFMSKQSREALVGTEGVVIEEINNEINMGKVYINHHEYNAQSVSGKQYGEYTPIKVLRVTKRFVYVKKI